MKSYLGSVGVSRQGFEGIADTARSTRFARFETLNDEHLRLEICKAACERFGYDLGAVELRMYVGKFAQGQEQDVRRHLEGLKPAVRVVGLGEIVAALVKLAGKRTYTDDPVVMTVKALAADGKLTKAAQPAF